ncbi:hypothetical protein ACEU6E_00080 [Halorutilales archaeon Cl-col2-1]
MNTHELMKQADWQDLKRDEDGEVSFSHPETGAVFSLVDVSGMEGMTGDVEGYYWRLTVDGVDYYEEMGETMAKWDTQDEAVDALRRVVEESEDIWVMM